MAQEVVAQEMVSAMKDATIIVESEAKINAGFVTGTLARSITSTVVPLGGTTKGIVSASASYAEFVEEGTGLFGPKKQLIKPKDKKALAWNGPNGMIFAKSTKGMKPKYYMKKAYDSKKQAVEARFNQAIANAVKELGK